MVKTKRILLNIIPHKNIHAAWLKVPTVVLQEVKKQSWGAEREEVTYCFSSPTYTLTEGNKGVGSQEKLKGETQSPFLTLCVLVAKRCPTPTTPWTAACQASLSMGFSRKKYWSALSFPSPRGSSQPRDQTQVSCIVDRFFTNWA